MQRFLYIIFLSILIPSQSKVGTTAAQFLGIGIGSKAMSMAGAFTSIADDPSCMYWNPGAIANINNTKMQFLKSDWLLDTQWYYSGYVKKIDNNSAIGFNLFYLDYGEEERTTVYDQDGAGDYWTANDLSLGIYYGMKLTNKFSFGGGFKYIKQSIYNESVSNLGIDLGLLYHNYIHKYRLGVSISNVGTDMRLEGNDLYYNCDLDEQNQGNNDNITCIIKTDDFPLPIFYRTGFSKDIDINSRLYYTGSIDWVIPSDDVEYINIGSEFNYNNRAFARIGYRQIGKDDSEEGLTFGIGANWFIGGKNLNINYTYHDFGIFGYMQYFEFIFNL